MKCLVVLGLLLLLVWMVPQGRASSVVEKFPTSTSVIVAGWNNPTWAYSDGGGMASTSTSLAEQEYDGFGFNLADNVTIDRVIVFVEFQIYCTIDVPDMFLSAFGSVKLYDGSGWKAYDYVKIDMMTFGNDYAEALEAPAISHGIDFSTWVTTPAEVNAMKLRLVGFLSADPSGTYLLSVDVVSILVAYTTPTPPPPPAENTIKYMLIGSIFSAPIMLAIALHYRKHQKP